MATLTKIFSSFQRELGDHHWVLKYLVPTNSEELSKINCVVKRTTDLGGLYISNTPGAENLN